MENGYKFSIYEPKVISNNETIQKRNVSEKEVQRGEGPENTQEKREC